MSKRYGEDECRMLIDAEIAHERIAGVCADAHKGHISTEEARRRIHEANGVLAGGGDIELVCRGEPHRCQQELIHSFEARIERLEARLALLDPVWTRAKEWMQIAHAVSKTSMMYHVDSNLIDAITKALAVEIG